MSTSHRIEGEGDTRLSELLAALLVALSMGSGEARAGDVAPELEAYLTDLGFSRSEIASLDAGSVPGRVLPEKDDNAAFVVAVARVAGTEAALLEEIRRLGESREDGRVLQSGRFATPPDPDDLRSLSFDEKELREFRRCRARDCGIKADAEMIALAESIDARAPDVVSQSSVAIKRALVERAKEYLEGGAAGMPVYRDNDDPESTGAEFARILRDSPRLVERNPGFYRYLVEFPGGAPPDVESFLYWTKEKLRKPVVSLVHVFLQRIGEGANARYFMALKHVYDSHYFLACAEFLETFPGPTAGSGFYVVRSVRARIDPPHLLRGLLLGRIDRAMRREVVEGLEGMKRRLDACVANRPAGLRCSGGLSEGPETLLMLGSRPWTVAATATGLPR